MERPGSNEVPYSRRLNRLAWGLGLLWLLTMGGMLTSSWAFGWSPSPTLRGYAVLGTLTVVSLCLSLVDFGSFYARRESES